MHPKNTACDRIQHSEATTERLGLAPSSASLRQSVKFTHDATRRMGSLHTYIAFGRKRPLIPLPGTRSTTTKTITLDKTKTCLPNLLCDPRPTLPRMPAHNTNTNMYARSPYGLHAPSPIEISHSLIRLTNPTHTKDTNPATLRESGGRA